MKKYLKNITAVLVGCILFTSCDDYLDVKPENQFLEDGMFSTPSGTQTVLNGIYLDMTSGSLYGGGLTMSTVDIFAQLYNTDTSTPHKYKEYKDINYTASNVRGALDNIWTSAYVNILNINNFIKQVEARDNLLPEKEENILLGEAYALRAMLHFDLLRLFGPIYVKSPEDPSIPYNVDVQSTITPLLKASEAMEKILADLTSAETFLENDPIREFGKINVSQEEQLDSDDPLYKYRESDFYRFRNKRMNYYAVKALQARVNLYAGNNTAALTAAKLVIEEASVWFPWTPFKEVISAGANPDRIFSSEIIFGLNNNDLYNQQRDLFAASLDEVGILAAKSKLDFFFEGNDNDYRRLSSWALPVLGEHSFPTFFKYADVHDPKMGFRFFQPLIRMSEMYLIAAELEANEADALTYLNAQRFNRGIPDIDPGADIQEEILKEYRREFYAEGQMFFYYKRKNISEIPNANSSRTIEMGDAEYVAPLPDSESNYRNN
ncbi:RagB/SusD family nutrient uptake outer membrane protein [Flavivirga spongiicola]|uniref:RagB/SusD family nutrient uptake outer membrane protein n=1 Tax=Flavivirga spongiicola TaxID=421621 RepID=A0ABU7XUP2_9FLAO|nr:RagB/SusD family nutrient uptake outer membrane protein [Flavivirga sp. MEBiC05379]MDO5979506.1 RagB/SusD family nutrient uptake outer membrane protein [Flavivirga sp. MEBiC05379]